MKKFVSLVPRIDRIWVSAVIGSLAWVSATLKETGLTLLWWFSIETASYLFVLAVDS